MIILDTDHLSILNYPESEKFDRLYTEASDWLPGLRILRCEADTGTGIIKSNEPACICDESVYAQSLSRHGSIP